ncbi:hypothetical protein HDU91_003234 [Kappamyces sp. JEL0680]|nr:hypothetical protein HDU91_003234 [Kappamyces sp. JEL0680]
MVKRQQPASWTDRLFSLHKSVSRIAMDGPFCSPPFEVSQLGCLVCVVAGSGAAAAFPLIHQVSARGIPVYLFWSIRDPSLVQLSFFQELEQCHGIAAKVFITQSDLKTVTVSDPLDTQSLRGKSFDEETLFTPASETAPGRFYQQTTGRMNVPLEFARMKKYHGTTGVYLCGPLSFMSDVETICADYPTFLPHRETYEW